MALFRLNIVWNDDSKNTIVYKYPLKNYGREINNKSTLTVKESQCAILEIWFPDAHHLRRLLYKHQTVH